MQERHNMQGQMQEQGSSNIALLRINWHFRKLRTTSHLCLLEQFAAALSIDMEIQPKETRGLCTILMLAEVLRRK